MLLWHLPEGQVNWWATIPRLEGPLSKHQKYFLQSRGCGKNPSSLQTKSEKSTEQLLFDMFNPHLSQESIKPFCSSWIPPTST